jgi:hypothetical protein
VSNSSINSAAEIVRFAAAAEQEIGEGEVVMRRTIKRSVIGLLIAGALAFSADGADALAAPHRTAAIKEVASKPTHLNPGNIRTATLIRTAIAGMAHSMGTITAGIEADDSFVALRSNARRSSGAR